MPSDIPIACTLNPAEIRDRVTSIEALLIDALLDQREIAGGLRTTFHDTPDVERRVRAHTPAPSPSRWP